MNIRPASAKTPIATTAMRGIITLIFNTFTSLLLLRHPRKSGCFGRFARPLQGAMTIGAQKEEVGLRRGSNGSNITRYRLPGPLGLATIWWLRE